MELFPKSPDFFVWFTDMADAIHMQCNLLRDMDVHPQKAIPIAKKIRAIETNVDELMHTIDTQADKTFITPFDREDLHALARQLNTIADSIENAASGITLTQFTKNGKYLPSYIKLIHDISKAVASLMYDLSKKDKYLDRMKKTIQSIHDMENEGDDLFRTALRELFSKNHDARTIFKWHYVYDNLELVLDACERTADITNTIIIKNY